MTTWTQTTATATAWTAQVPVGGFTDEAFEETAFFCADDMEWTEVSPAVTVWTPAA